MRRFLWLRAAGWLGALAVTSSAVAQQEATPPQPEVVRPLTPIPPERLEQMVPKHPGYLGALAPENLRKARPAAPFDVTGTWFVDLSKGFADYMFGPPYPRFGPEGVEALIEQPKAQARGETYRDAIGQCYPPGMPMLMTRVWPHAFIQLPTAIYVISGFNNSVRTIFPDGRAHEEDPDPSFMGDSIGRWEGDTLVVDTIGISGELEIDTGWPHSDQFRLTERIHLDPADPNVLVNEMRMEDPEALAEPFVVTTRYRRDRYGKLIEFQCSENDRNPVDEDGNTRFD